MIKNHSVSIITATAKCISILDRDSLALLARHCPGLKTFDWISYLMASRCRIEKIYEALVRFYPEIDKGTGQSPKILDFGAWLGNFSLALRNEGLNVTAAEMWARYSPALDAQKRLLADNAIDCIDTTMIVGRPQGPTFDIVLFMAVIEHLADSPRQLLRVLNNILKPGGLLILDTPNLAYIFNRRKLNRGESPYVPITEQFYTEFPFEGHVREYTAAELEWMLVQSGFEVLQTDFFNYAYIEWWIYPLVKAAMWASPSKRELIFIVARKK